MKYHCPNCEDENKDVGFFLLSVVTHITHDGRESDLAGGQELMRCANCGSTAPEDDFLTEEGRKVGGTKQEES